MLYALAIGVSLGFASLFFSKKSTTKNKPTVSAKLNLAGMHKLRSSPVHATLTRQSGNEYRDLGIFQTPDDACREIEKSFRRAQITSISVLQNSTNCFEVTRKWYNGRGRAEGKKLGGAIIIVL